MQMGGLRDGWLRAFYAAIIVIAAAGALAPRSDTRRISLWVRAAFGLAVVFLMIAKPEPR